jgi:hypothetical protein
MGWFAVTILLPCLAPLLASLTFKLLTLPDGVEARPMNAFRDGQLCWAAIGFCASALYELGQAESEEAGWIHGGLTLVTVLSSLIAAGGAIFPVRSRSTTANWIWRYRCLMASVILCMAAGVLYTIVHF